MQQGQASRVLLVRGSKLRMAKVSVVPMCSAMLPSVCGRYLPIYRWRGREGDRQTDRQMKKDSPKKTEGSKVS